MLGNVRLRMKPDNLECNLCLKYNLRALDITSKDKLKQAPNEFVAPNSPENVLPNAERVTNEAIEARDMFDIEIVILSDDESDAD